MEIAKKWLERILELVRSTIQTKNQDNPIKTVGRDSFLSPKTPKNRSFYGSPSPQGLHSPYVVGDTTRPRHITYVLVLSKSDQRRLRKNSAQTNKQTNRQTDRQTDRQTNRHYENNGHLAVNQYATSEMRTRVSKTTFVLDKRVHGCKRASLGVQSYP